MAKSYGAKGLSGDAKAWNDAAPAMARQNAKSPMVIEQSPNGMIMGRATSAKPSPNRNIGKTLTGNFKPLTTKERAQRDAGDWAGAAPRLERQNNMAGPMVYTQDAKSGKISGTKVGYRTFDRTLQTGSRNSPTTKGQGAFIDGKPVTKAQAAYINDGTVPMVKGKKKLEMCPDCGKPMFGGKCSCGGDMGKSMRKGMAKGDMCKCGSGMTKAMCKCGGMSKSAKKTRGSTESTGVKLSPAQQAEQARWDGLTKGIKTSMKKAMPIAQPNPMNSRPIQDPGLPPKTSPIPPPRNTGPMKPMPTPSKGTPKAPMPMPKAPMPGKSGQYGGINPAGMYGKVSKRSK